ADAVLARAQRLHDAVDAVAGQPEDDVDVPVQQGLDQYVRRRLRHRCLLVRLARLLVRLARSADQDQSGCCIADASDGARLGRIRQRSARPATRTELASGGVSTPAPTSVATPASCRMRPPSEVAG